MCMVSKNNVSLNNNFSITAYNEKDVCWNVKNNYSTSSLQEHLSLPNRSHIIDHLVHCFVYAEKVKLQNLVFI